MARLSDVPNWTKRDAKPDVDDLSSSESVCIICGKTVERGGYWQGAEGDIVVCTRDVCIEKLLHTAFDAWLDKDPGDAPNLYAWWWELTGNVLSKKQPHLIRTIPDD